MILSTVDELINHFIYETKCIHEAIGKIDSFTYSYDICATLKDNKTAHITLDELNKLWGFFLVKAAYKTKDITYIVSFGDKDFALYYEVETKPCFFRHTYSIDHYTKALNFQPVQGGSYIKDISFMTQQLDSFQKCVLGTYDLFLKHKRKIDRLMENYQKEYTKRLNEEYSTYSARNDIKKANQLFKQKEFKKAFKMYRENEKYLKKSEQAKMNYCEKHISSNIQ